MLRAFVFIVILAALAFVGLGCRGRCAQLCARQAECATSGAGGTDSLGPAENLQVCRAFCDTATEDPARREVMERVLACVERACSEFRVCVRASATAATGRP